MCIGHLFNLFVSVFIVKTWRFTQLFGSFQDFDNFIKKRAIDTVLSWKSVMLISLNIFLNVLNFHAPAIVTADISPFWQ